MNKPSRRVRKAREDPTLKLAKTILPAEQIAHGGLVIRDVANHTDADQRASVRSGETKTVRKLTKVELMTKAGVINSDQALACAWFSSSYEMGFCTVKCTSNYNASGGGGFGSSDLLARYKEQAEARENYYYAKSAIPRHLVGLFEEIVLGSGTIRSKEDQLRFSLAAFKLHDQICHLLEAA